MWFNRSKQCYRTFSTADWWNTLIYTMTSTQPDLSYVIGKLSQNLSKPSNTNLYLARYRYTLKYIKGTLTESLIFHKCVHPLELTG